ncbi:MAG: DUF3570 domain-containing protein [Halobacteriovoraceae bacterium]|nr:DUF3570 domain-containing protein [Halobacteriovoraceae bacterium]
MVVVAVIRLKKILLSLFLLFNSIQNVFAEMMTKGKTKFKFLLNLYHQNSTDGRQVFDNSGREQANVFEPMLFIEHQVNENTALNAHFVFDLWTAASDTRLDALTGASGDSPIKLQSRGSGNIGIRKESGKWGFSAGFGFSSEYDYRSINANMNLQRSFAKDNFTVALGLQYYLDGVQLFPDLTPPVDADLSEFLSRKIIASHLTISQILTRKDIIQIGANFINARGSLESTASSVLVNGIREIEQLPDTRSRYAVSSKWVHGFNDKTAMNISYRRYLDQWDLNAHTAKLSILREINDDEDFIEISMRWHQQSKVLYYEDSFATPREFMTSDSDLNKFTSHELGLFHSANLGNKKLWGFTLDDFTWNNGITVYERSTGLIYGYVQSSIGFMF